MYRHTFSGYQLAGLNGRKIYRTGTDMHELIVKEQREEGKYTWCRLAWLNKGWWHSGKMGTARKWGKGIC